MGLSQIALSALALTGSALAQSGGSKDLPSIIMKGNKLFYPNGTQFFMKGIAYQQDTAAAGETNEKTTTYKDPLSNAKLCERDVPLLKEMDVNIIRTYAIDPEADHSACMKLLQEAGIYVISDLSEPALSVNRDDPKWTTEHLDRFTSVIDEMAKYSNVVGFFAGNEVSNNKSNTDASAYIKAAVRDTKKHIKSNVDRWLGVGYAANDDPEINDDIAKYFNCGEDDERIDYWGFNIYSWCGESTMEKSGYNKWTKYFTDYPVPVFFAEYGCNEPDGAAARIFQETEALYEDQMAEVFSGGLMYMYFQEENDYGVVKIDKDGKPVKQKDFERFAKKQKAADPKGVDMDEYTPSTNKLECPKMNDIWRANTNLPPTPDKDLCSCMQKSLSCVRDDKLEKKDFGDVFDFICGKKPQLCKGIQANGTSGVYGAYSMCDDGAKLDFVLDAYYEELGKSSDACDFDGAAKQQTGSTASSCSDSLEAAKSHNEVVATATSALDNVDGPSGGSSDNEDDDSFGIRGASVAGLSTLVGLTVGVGMLML